MIESIKQITTISTDLKITFWMVKRAQSQSDTRENLKNRLMLDHVPPRRVSVKKESVSISYEK